MRATILHQAIILTKAYRAAVGMMAKGCIVALVLSMRYFSFSVCISHHVLGVWGTEWCRGLLKSRPCFSSRPSSALTTTPAIRGDL